MSELTAYIEGWNACENGEDGRYTNPHPSGSPAAFAWNHGFLDCMESEDGDGDYPDPKAAGYTSY